MEWLWKLAKVEPSMFQVNTSASKIRKNLNIFGKRSIKPMLINVSLITDVPLSLVEINKNIF